MTLVGTVRKNEPEIPTLFPSGKQRDICSSIFGFTNQLALVMYQQEARLSSFHYSIIMMCVGEERDYRPEIIMH
jgi:hypothetical protein